MGKSTVAVNLAAALAMAGKQVGLLDIDVHGPSVPKLLHLEGALISSDGDGMIPVEVDFQTGKIRVMSIGFLLRGKDAVIWRGPRKYGLIKQFLKDVAWGSLDYLVIDSPPGTGDEPLAVAELIEKADGAIVVTTPQEVAVQDVPSLCGLLPRIETARARHCGKHERLHMPEVWQTRSHFWSGWGSNNGGRNGSSLPERYSH